MPEIAIGALISNGTVLLARRNPQRSIYPDCWSLPGGHVEDGEEAAAAMRRELMEEIGVTPERWQLAATFVSEGSLGAPTAFHVYRVERWQGSPQLADEEHTALGWFTANEIEGEIELAPPQFGEILAKLLERETGKSG